jgi:hypothetical protein
MFYLNGVKVDAIPPEALTKMSERLSYTVSAYFQRHPEEYEAFHKSMTGGSDGRKKTAVSRERQAVRQLREVR